MTRKKAGPVLSYYDKTGPAFLPNTIMIIEEKCDEIWENDNEVFCYELVPIDQIRRK